MTESLNHKCNTNDVDQTAQLFYRFIVVVCKAISQYHFVFLNHFMGDNKIKHVNLDIFFNSILNATWHASPFCFAYAVPTLYI